MTTPISTMSATWTLVGTTYTAIKMNVTDTASASGSLLMDLQVGGTSYYKVSKAGLTTIGGGGNTTAQLTFTPNSGAAVSLGASNGGSALTWFGGASKGGTLSASGITFPSTGTLSFGANSDPNSTMDVVLARDAANTLAQRNSTNAQAFRVYNTYTDASNYERVYIQADSGASTSRIGRENAGTGVGRELEIHNAANENVGINIAAVRRWNFSAAALYPHVNNSYDAGLTGTRFRTGYFGTSVVTPKLIASGGTTPTVVCGTSATITGNDSACTVTVGTGGIATTCVVTFNAAWAAAPVCIAQSDTDLVALTITSTTTTCTVTKATPFTAGSKLNIMFIGI